MDPAPLCEKAMGLESIHANRTAIAASIATLM
jgi:hypothetical protein